jgi:hypothetical protein
MTLQSLFTFPGFRLKFVTELLQASNLVFNFPDLFDQESPHMLAGRISDKSQFHQLPDLVQRKTQRLALFDKFHAFQVLRRIDPVTARASLWTGEQSAALVISNRLRLHADPVGEITRAKNALFHTLRLNPETNLRVNKNLGFTAVSVA